MFQQYILLVGGFGESPYLQKRLTETFNDKGVAILSLEGPKFVHPTPHYLLTDIFGTIQNEGRGVSVLIRRNFSPVC